MLKMNVTLHEASVLGEQQVLEPRAEQRKTNSHTPLQQGKKASSFAVLFKEMSHTLYLWMD
jgi:hypothetical protein